MLVEAIVPLRSSSEESAIEGAGRGGVLVCAIQRLVRLKGPGKEAYPYPQPGYRPGTRILQ